MKKLIDKQINIIKQKINITEKMFIVRLEIVNDSTVSSEELNRNVYCINENYDIIWQIKHDSKCPHPNMPFVHIKIFGNELISIDFAGFIYKVNLNNGDTKMINWNK